jgi:hypothetical protein
MEYLLIGMILLVAIILINDPACTKAEKEKRAERFEILLESSRLHKEV